MSASFPFVLPSGTLVCLPGHLGQERSDPQVPRTADNPATAAKQAGGAPGIESKAGATQGQGQGQPAKKPPMNPNACMSQALIFVPFLLLMYFLMIRPQQKQEKQRKAMLSAIKKGDHIVTSGGLYGQIDTLDERIVYVKLGSGDAPRLKFDRSAIARVIPVGGEKDPTDK